MAHAALTLTENRSLRDLRGVGKSIEADLQSLGIHTVEELAMADGTQLYEHLNQFSGVRQDPCVLDTFRCAVAQAQNRHLPANQTNWWWWSQQRKLGLL